MTRFTQLILAAALGGTALAGTAYAAQDQAQPTPPAVGMHRHHRGHGDPLARMDANKDGVVTRAEAIAAADARFAKTDTNGDGKITQDEIQAQRDAMRQRMEQRRAAQGGQAGADTDAQPGMHRRGGHHGDMMKEMDANGDGVVTQTEAEAAATARFDKLDANHDGRIDQSEMAAIKAKMQARMAEMRAKWQARQSVAPAADDQSTDQ